MIKLRTTESMSVGALLGWTMPDLAEPVLRTNERQTIIGVLARDVQQNEIVYYDPEGNTPDITAKMDDDSLVERLEAAGFVLEREKCQCGHVVEAHSVITTACLVCECIKFRGW